MTVDEAHKYIIENKPTATKTDEVGRWISRTWNALNAVITETYEYKYDAQTIKQNRDVTKYRDSFTVINTNLEIV